MTQSLKILLLIFSASLVLTGVAAWTVSDLSGRSQDQSRTAQHEAIADIAAHNLTPWILTDDQFAIQAELNFLTETVGFSHASVSTPERQTIAIAENGSSTGGATGTALIERDIQVDRELAAVLQIYYDSELVTANSSFAYLFAVALLCACLITALLSFLLRTSNRRALTLAQRFEDLLGIGNSNLSEPIARIETASVHLSRELAPLDPADMDEPTATTQSELRVIAMFSTVQLSEWQRLADSRTFDQVLYNFERRLRDMLRLYRGKLLVIDDHRLVIDFGELSARRVRQSLVFSMGVLKSLARECSPFENHPLPLTGALFPLPGRSSLLSFMQGSHRSLDRRSDLLQNMSAGHLLVDLDIYDETTEEMVDSSTSIEDGYLVNALKPAYLKLWANQSSRLIDSE